MQALCEWPNCLAPAEAEVGAQWTVVDFINVESCAEHVDIWIERFLKTRIDGQYPLDVHWHWFER